MTDIDKATEADDAATIAAAQDVVDKEIETEDARDSDAAILENDAHNGFTDEPNVVLSGN